MGDLVVVGVLCKCVGGLVVVVVVVGVILCGWFGGGGGVYVSICVV